MAGDILSSRCPCSRLPLCSKAGKNGEVASDRQRRDSVASLKQRLEDEESRPALSASHSGKKGSGGRRGKKGKKGGQLRLLQERCAHCQELYTEVSRGLSIFWSVSHIYLLLLQRSFFTLSATRRYLLHTHCPLPPTTFAHMLSYSLIFRNAIYGGCFFNCILVAQKSLLKRRKDRRVPT